MSRHDIAARERELAAIYDHIPGILFYVAIEPDGDFRFVSMSQAGLAATGLTRERFVGSLVRHVIPPASRELVLNNYREAIRTRRTVRWKEVSDYPAGRKIGEVAVTPLYDANGVATHLSESFTTSSWSRRTPCSSRCSAGGEARSSGDPSKR